MIKGSHKVGKDRGIRFPGTSLSHGYLPNVLGPKWGTISDMTVCFSLQLSWGTRQPMPEEDQQQGRYFSLSKSATRAAQWLAMLRVLAGRYPVITSVAGVMAVKIVLQLTGLDFCFIRIP